jgi:hypothetical protein
MRARSLGALTTFLVVLGCSTPSQSPEPPEIHVRGEVAVAGEITAHPDAAPADLSVDAAWDLSDGAAELPGMELPLPLDVEVAPEIADAAPSLTLGTVTGTCGELAQIITEGQATFTKNSYLFDSPLFAAELLGEGAQKRYELDNVGGSSLCSEVMSIQLLEECAGATLYKTESEIDYGSPGDMADYLVDIAGLRVGVSVTRAYKGPMGDTYTLEDATTLLTKKLAGLDAASVNVVPEDGFTRKLLHIWTLREDWVPLVESAYQDLPAALRSDIIVLITVEENSAWVVPEACK